MKLTFKILCMKFFNYPAPIFVVTGKPDSRKTDFVLWINQKLLEWKIIDLCASNIQVHDNRFVKLTALESLEKWLNLFKRKRKVFILDEADQCMTNLDVVSRLSKKFRVPMAFQIRKFHAKLFLIYHRLKDVPELYLDKNVTTAFIHKRSKKVALIRSDLIFPLIRENHLTLTYIPRTKIGFNTFGIGQFTQENKIEKEMLELWYKKIYLSKRGYNDEQIKAILKT